MSGHDACKATGASAGSDATSGLQSTMEGVAHIASTAGGRHRFLATRQVGYQDMIKLPDLAEDALLGNLRDRFFAEIVYTYIGDIVVSVNPFKKTGNSDPEVQQEYVRLSPGEQLAKLPPHIYCLVSQAYRHMRDSNKSLSVLISGESGAGKTEAMKLCVSHLGAVARKPDGGHSGVSNNVASRLMKTNPVMEPIGNAKTVRNNNSSRFGKHFDIQFNRDGHIIGALTSVYLLEKPRITEHMTGERNYHIFYMLTKAPEEIRSPGKLQEWEHYRILKQEGTVEQVTSWNDLEEFVAMHAALHELGFSNEQRTEFYVMVSIVMQLGNVHFEPVELADGEGAKVVDMEQFSLVAELMQVANDELLSALTKTMLVVGLDMISQDLSARKAKGALNSLCMHIYSLAFGWCVKKINDTIAMPDGEVHRCVGVLDIFGFENFNAKGQVNSFPQLCINLTNERLHQLFIEHIFQVEQRFYESEDIEWTTVDYNDNKPIIELITRRPGVFALIDDECQKRTATNDEALLANLHEHFDKPPHRDQVYSKPKQPGTFIIHHYAGAVSYKIAGFIEKNKDELSPTICALLEQHTKFETLKELAQMEKRRNEIAVLDKESKPAKSKGGRAKGGGGRTRKKTVSESFGESLNLLMNKLSSTDHHYIRCLKPNHTLRPGDFDDDLMLRQLAYSGTLEVTKVRKAGLNVRWELSRFYDWYKICAKDMRALKASSQREQVRLLLVQVELDPNTWRVGRTLVFMASMEVLDELDKLREERVKDYARLILGHWQMRKQYKLFKVKQAGARKLQHALRGVRTRRAYTTVREKTKLLQHAALVKIARMRAADLKADPMRFAELMNEGEGALNEMVNEETGEQISLTHSIAMGQMTTQAVSAEEADDAMKSMTVDQRAQLLKKKAELASSSPAEIIMGASLRQLTTTVLTSMLWQRSGAHVRVAGKVDKVVDEVKLPRFRYDTDGTTPPWSALLHVRIEQVDAQVRVIQNATSTGEEADDGENSSRRAGASSLSQLGKRQLAEPSNMCQVYATIQRGTLTLEVFDETDHHRTVIRKLPLALCSMQNLADTPTRCVVVEQVRPLIWEAPNTEQEISSVASIGWLSRWITSFLTAMGLSRNHETAHARTSKRVTTRDEHLDRESTRNTNAEERATFGRNRISTRMTSASVPSPEPATGKEPVCERFTFTQQTPGSFHAVDKSRTSVGHSNSHSLSEFAVALGETIDDSHTVDAFVVRPKVPHTESVSSKSAPASLEFQSSVKSLHDHTTSSLQSVKQGFLLCQLRDGKWARRYFVLYANGSLCWYCNREDVHSLKAECAHSNSQMGQEGSSTALDLAGGSLGSVYVKGKAVGQLTLRFFAVNRSPNSQQSVDDDQDLFAEFENPEIEYMLQSCSLFELRSGDDVLHLATQRVAAEEWLEALSMQCMLNYPKSPTFSDKEVHVLWMDGQQFTCAVGENTTAQDIVKRLCRSRRANDGGVGRQAEPLVRDSTEWSLCEVQQHARTLASHENHLSLHKLPNNELIVDQVLQRWEVASRRLYGATGIVPQHSFELHLRKTVASNPVTTGSRIMPPEEVALELCQARADLLGGRLNSVLCESEALELAAVLTLWEMHRRGPRVQVSATRAAIQMQLRQKLSNPTLDFDMVVDELSRVLPEGLLDGVSENAAQKTLKQIKQAYVRLLKDPVDSWPPQLTLPESATATLVRDIRSQVLGVSFDSKGQVVVDKRAAERILRERLGEEPLSFGALYSVHVWTSDSHTPEKRLVSVNHNGLHLYTWEQQPKHVASFLYTWQTASESNENTVIGWQTVARQFANNSEQQMAEELSLTGDSLVVHVLVPPTPSARDQTDDRSDAPLQSGGCRGSIQMVKTTKPKRAVPRKHLGSVLMPLDESSSCPVLGDIQSGKSYDRETTAAELRITRKIARRRAKLVLLTREGNEIKTRLQLFAQDHVKKGLRQAASKPRSPPQARMSTLLLSEVQTQPLRGACGESWNATCATGGWSGGMTAR